MRCRIALAFLVALASMFYGAHAAAADDRFGQESGSLTNDAAVVHATDPGSPGSSTSGTALPPLPAGFVRCNDGRVVREQDQSAVCRDEITVVGPPVPTMNDLRSFYPERPIVSGEPVGWAVKGLPANLTAPVATHTRSGPLLGRTAEVRFIPTRWLWTYGDGQTASTTTGGETWEALGQPRFTETATSHIYRSRGNVSALVSVVYSVEYRYGGGAWRPIDGVLTLDSPATPLKVVVGSTVLTDRACEDASASC